MRLRKRVEMLESAVFGRSPQKTGADARIAELEHLLAETRSAVAFLYAHFGLNTRLGCDNTHYEGKEHRYEFGRKVD